MSARDYLTPVLKWWWLIVVSAALAAVACCVFILKQPLQYSSRTTLMIGQTISEPNPNNTEFGMGQQLAIFYADLARREPVKSATLAALGLQVLPTYRVNALTSSQMVEIIVTDTLPERAASVANELAAQLIKISPSGVQGEDQSRQAFIQEQLDQLQAGIKQTNQDIAAKQAELLQLSSATEIQAQQEAIQALQEKVSLMQTNYATLLNSSRASATNILSVIEQAVPSTEPVGPSKVLIIALAEVLGLALGVGAAYLLEFVDQSVRDPDDISNLAGLPVVGYVYDIAKKVKYQPYVSENPHSPTADSFRSLKANLEVGGLTSPVAIMVTSPEPGDGKSFVAVNLAATLAKGGKRVVVVDADLRKPTLHQILRLPNPPWLSELFDGSDDILSAILPCDNEISGAITAEYLRTRINDQVDQETIHTILDPLKGAADYVVVDTPPLMVADTIAWAASVDGVLVVVRPEHTNRWSTRILSEQLARANARVLGIVMNHIPLSWATYGYYGKYRYYSYYSPDGSADPKSKVRATRHKRPKEKEKDHGDILAQASLSLIGQTNPEKEEHR